MAVESTREGWGQAILRPMSRPSDPLHLPCPLCGGEGAEELKRFADGVVVGRCTACGMIFTPLRHPLPHTVLGPGELDELRRRYAPVLSGGRHHYREGNYREYLRILSPPAPGRRLLDVGCAHGFFGREARAAGFEVTGVEPHPGMAAFAAAENGLRVIPGRIEDVRLDGESFDVATFTDSLEYVPDPLAALSTVRAALVPGGIVFIKVPNALYFQLRLALERRGIALGGGQVFGPSLRVSHFTTTTLAALLVKAGFEIVRVGFPGPIHSPATRRVAEWSEVAPRWWERLPERLARSASDLVGRVEAVLTGGANHGSPSLFALARRPG